MKLRTLVKPLGYLLIGLLLFVLAGRSSPFAGDGGPYVLQHDVREDPARDLIRAVREAVRRFRGVANTKAGDHHGLAGRASDADGGQTP